MSFAVAEQNFHHAARDGMDATLYWPGFGQVSADELVLRHLLPLAHEGLQEWGVSDAVRDRYLVGDRGTLQDRRQRRRPGRPRRWSGSRRRAWTGRVR